MSHISFCDIRLLVCKLLFFGLEVKIQTRAQPEKPHPHELLLHDRAHPETTTSNKMFPSIAHLFGLNCCNTPSQSIITWLGYARSHLDSHRVQTRNISASSTHRSCATCNFYFQLQQSTRALTQLPLQEKQGSAAVWATCWAVALPAATGTITSGTTTH